MNSKVIIDDKIFVPFISHSEIEAVVLEKALKISRYCKTNELQPVFIVVLKGAFMFASDLLKSIDPNLQCSVEFVKFSSYEGTESTGTIITDLPLKTNVKGKPVYVIEDVIDTGTTMKFFTEQLRKQNPKEIHLIPLLLKPLALKHDLGKIEACFKIKNEFVLGYGLDLDGIGRNLPQIYKLQKRNVPLNKKRLHT